MMAMQLLSQAASGQTPTHSTLNSATGLWELHNQQTLARRGRVMVGPGLTGAGGGNVAVAGAGGATTGTGYPGVSLSGSSGSSSTTSGTATGGSASHNPSSGQASLPGLTPTSGGLPASLLFYPPPPDQPLPPLPPPTPVDRDFASGVSILDVGLTGSPCSGGPRTLFGSNTGDSATSNNPLLRAAGGLEGPSRAEVVPRDGRPVSETSSHHVVPYAASSSIGTGSGVGCAPIRQLVCASTGSSALPITTATVASAAATTMTNDSGLISSPANLAGLISISGSPGDPGQPGADLQAAMSMAGFARTFASGIPMACDTGSQLPLPVGKPCLSRHLPIAF
ncbi:unnamed protein product, partial [Protopolystoma xenopodis]